jgi:hypothetical protein
VFLFCLSSFNTQYNGFLHLSQVVREIDDHADIIGMEIVTETTHCGGKYPRLVSRHLVVRVGMAMGFHFLLLTTRKQNVFSRPCACEFFCYHLFNCTNKT